MRQLKVDELFPCISNSSSLLFRFFCIIFSTSIQFHYFIFNLGSFLPKDACTFYRSRQELSNEYFLAKFSADTAENEPL